MPFCGSASPLPANAGSMRLGVCDPKGRGAWGVRREPPAGSPTRPDVGATSLLGRRTPRPSCVPGLACIRRMVLWGQPGAGAAPAPSELRDKRQVHPASALTQHRPASFRDLGAPFPARAPLAGADHLAFQWLPPPPPPRRQTCCSKDGHGRSWALRIYRLEKNQSAALLEASTDIPGPGAASVPVRVLTARQAGHATVLLGRPAAVTVTLPCRAWAAGLGSREDHQLTRLPCNPSHHASEPEALLPVGVPSASATMGGPPRTSGCPCHIVDDGGHADASPGLS